MSRGNSELREEDFVLKVSFWEQSMTENQMKHGRLKGARSRGWPSSLDREDDQEGFDDAIFQDTWSERSINDHKLTC